MVEAELAALAAEFLAGDDPREKGMPLINALQSGHLDVVHLLLDPNVHTLDGVVTWSLAPGTTVIGE